MKIGVNSRIHQNSKTGIPYYIECLYKKCIQIDEKNSYVFFQTQRKSLIGNTKLVDLPNTSFNAFAFDNFLITKLIKKEKVTIFHGPASILPFFKQRNVKYIVTVHDLSFLLFPTYHSKLFNLYYKYFVGRSLKNADIVVADSCNTKNDIEKIYKIKKEKIKVIYPGINEMFFEKKKHKELIKKEYFLTLTTHPKRKNIIRLLEIMKSNKYLQNYVFVIAGLMNKEQKEQLHSYVKELGLEKRVILFGYATEEELVQLYSSAAFFIFPSYYEGFGFPVLEAMICKCPVLASNTSSIPEITPNGDWLFDPYDSHSISKKIEKILKISVNEKKKIIQSNYDFAKKFTWERSAQQLINLFV